MSYPFAAFVAGCLAERGFDRRFATSVLAMGAGLLVVFAGGLPGWRGESAPLGLDRALAIGLYPFLSADILKVLLAASILPWPGAFCARSSSRRSTYPVFSVTDSHTHVRPLLPRGRKLYEPTRDRKILSFDLVKSNPRPSPRTYRTYPRLLSLSIIS